MQKDPAMLSAQAPEEVQPVPPQAANPGVPASDANQFEALMKKVNNQDRTDRAQSQYEGRRSKVIDEPIEMEEMAPPEMDTISEIPLNQDLMRQPSMGAISELQKIPTYYGDKSPHGASPSWAQQPQNKAAPHV